MARKSFIFFHHFLPFLIERGLYGSFISNYYKSFPDTPLTRYACTTDPSSWLVCAFDFEKAPEGFKFWKTIDLAWQSYSYPNFS